MIMAVAFSTILAETLPWISSVVTIGKSRPSALRKRARVSPSASGQCSATIAPCSASRSPSSSLSERTRSTSSPARVS